mmetsp:Transcript_25191/g.45397  ORF Transcript_25191/g.45397 Transcript_25191/m.45397 type:complete len:401 (+) Transcript_25191:143-1345(+)
MKLMKLTSFLAATVSVSLVAADSRDAKAERGSGTGVEVSAEDESFGGGSGDGGCIGRKDIPFMMTNVELTEDGDEHYFGFHNTDTESETQFLKDVRYCPDAGRFGAYRIYGEVVSLEDFKAAVEEEVSTNDAVDHVMYHFHGWRVDPESSFMQAHSFMEMHEENTGYLWIPISWRTHWGSSRAFYDIDRNGNAIRAGETFGASVDVFKLSVPTSLMAHSMGNYVTRQVAQNTVDPEIIFENIFMVSADARMDMFSPEFNPAAPKHMNTQGKTDQANVYLDIPDEELRENGGYALTRIANHIHVLWNSNDPALDIRELFQIGFGENIRRALGKYGEEAEELTRTPYFQERVTYHDFSYQGREHSYQFFQDAVDIYAQYKSGENTIATTGGFKMLRASGRVN